MNPTIVSSIIRSIACRKVLNSHVAFTNEFVIELNDGMAGIGASPQGETISMYEDKSLSAEPEAILKAIRTAGYIGMSLNQERFDEYLIANAGFFGRNNSFALSEAFFNATRKRHTLNELFGLTDTKLCLPPRICCNILNGGRHAYTNPVLSDFPEYILVSQIACIEEVIDNHNAIQRNVREKLRQHVTSDISGNPVHRFATSDNRECIDFLLSVCEKLNLTRKFDLMIDASAGDLWQDGNYHFSIADHTSRSSERFIDYWLDIARQYNLRFLEDPFHEKDYRSWRQLSTSQDSCAVIGDNFYSSDAKRIEEGAANRYTHGTIIKPNQAGTVTAVRRALESAVSCGQIPITSHRSISTESIFLSILTCMYDVQFIKIGPLATDYSSIVRLNEIIRLTENTACKHP